MAFHGHENLVLGVASSVVALRAGAVQIDGSTRRFGAGAGNTPVEALVAVCDRLGFRTGVDVFAIFDAAEDVVRPVMDTECAWKGGRRRPGYGARVDPPSVRRSGGWRPGRVVG